MDEKTKWAIRPALAIMALFSMIVFAGIALFGELDQALFWKIFLALSVYPDAFFVLRQVEKRKQK